MKLLLLTIPLLATACVELDEDVAVETAEITGSGWQYANQDIVDRAIKIPGCTATRIAHRWAITAAHCTPDLQAVITLYDHATSTQIGTPRDARIVGVVYPPGLVLDSDCLDDGVCEDGDGHHADMALLQIASTDEEDLDSPSAVLAWKFPGEVWGKQVGAGRHDNVSNPEERLRMIDARIDSDDSDGWFHNVDDQTNPGDSGGPFYVGSYGARKVVGVLTGDWWEPLDHYNLYTSVPYRIGWILGAIDYKWLGSPPRENHRYVGTTIETIVNATHRTCQYACEHTDSCEGYDYYAALDQCLILDNITSSTTSAATDVHSALRNGGPSGVSSDSVGYVRADKRNVVVHMNDENGATSDNTIRELAQISTAPYWQDYNLMNGAPAPAYGGKVSAYRRSDDIDAVVYRSSGNQIIEIARLASGWVWNVLPASGTPNGAPVGMIRADGENVVLYRTSDGDIRELHLDSTGQWEATNLSSASGAPAASSDLSAFRRSDGYTSIVYRSGTDIWELYKRPGEPWGAGNLSSLTKNGWAPAADSRPHGFKHANGFNAIVYRTTGDRVVEIWLDSSGWHYNYLPSSANLVGDPFAYVRADVVESVVSRNSSYRLTEIAQGSAGWQSYDLSNAGNPSLYTSPTAYMRTDGYNSVVYEGTQDDVVEVFWRKGDTAWGYQNLSNMAGEP